MSEPLRADPPTAQTKRWGKNHPGYLLLKEHRKNNIPVNLGTDKKSLIDIDFLVWNEHPEFFQFITKKNFREAYKKFQKDFQLDQELSGARKDAEGKY